MRRQRAQEATVNSLGLPPLSLVGEKGEYDKQLSMNGCLTLETYHPKTPEDADDTFSETSVRNSATRYKLLDIFNWDYRESIPEDIVLRTLTVSLYGEPQ
jgi:hypothetical protein